MLVPRVRVTPQIELWWRHDVKSEKAANMAKLAIDDCFSRFVCFIEDELACKK